MTTRTAIVSTIILFVATVGIAFLILALTFDGFDPRAEEKAGQLGSGSGMIFTIGCGIIWIWWAVNKRKSKRN